jgi:broad specificity phosphatase PhoE
LDPALTQKGIDQCIDLRTNFDYMSQVTHVVASPLRCALQTTVLGFNPVFMNSREVPIILWPDLREDGNLPCCHVKSLPHVHEVTSTQGILVDTTLLTPGWENFDDLRGARAKRVKEGLYELRKAIIAGNKWKGVDVRKATEASVHVLVVGHGDLMSQVVGYAALNHFQNGEVKSYVFKPRVHVLRSGGKAPYVLKRVNNCE